MRKVTPRTAFLQAAQSWHKRIECGMPSPQTEDFCITQNDWVVRFTHALGITCVDDSLILPGDGVLSSAAGADTQPLLVKLRELAEAQYSRKELADAVFAQAEIAFAEARENQRMEAVRHSAAAAAVTAAENYFFSLATEASSDDAPADSGSEAPPGAAAAPGRPVRHLIIDVLELGQATALMPIYEGVRRLRPGTSEGAIRGSLAKLGRSGAVEAVTRGVYRLLTIPEDYQADS